MIRISKMADYAVVILSVMAKEPDALMTTSALAERTRLAEPTVAKVLKILTRGEIIRSARGINGGYSLARGVSEVTLEEIIRAVDGPISVTSCADGSEPDCSLAGSCGVRGRWDHVNAAIRGALETVTLNDMRG